MITLNSSYHHLTIILTCYNNLMIILWFFYNHLMNTITVFLQSSYCHLMILSQYHVTIILWSSYNHQSLFDHLVIILWSSYDNLTIYHVAIILWTSYDYLMDFFTFWLYYNDFIIILQLTYANFTTIIRSHLHLMILLWSSYNHLMKNLGPCYGHLLIILQ